MRRSAGESLLLAPLAGKPGPSLPSVLEAGVCSYSCEGFSRGECLTTSCVPGDSDSNVDGNGVRVLGRGTNGDGEAGRRAGGASAPPAEAVMLRAGKSSMVAAAVAAAEMNATEVPFPALLPLMMALWPIASHGIAAVATILADAECRSLAMMLMVLLMNQNLRTSFA